MNYIIPGGILEQCAQQDLKAGFECFYLIFFSA